MIDIYKINKTKIIFDKLALWIHYSSSRKQLLKLKNELWLYYNYTKSLFSLKYNQ